ncbi:hypothetical protein KW448_19705 [Vibrio fluvialis]|nr:hypothetical protein [Vibrio fluvialis]
MNWNFDLFWPHLETNESDKQKNQDTLLNDISDIKSYSFENKNDTNTILDEVRRLYDQEQERRSGADGKAGIYIASVTALIAFFSTLTPDIDQNSFNVIAIFPFSMAIIQLIRSGLWALNTLKVTQYHLLNWKMLISKDNVEVNKRLIIELLISLRANYDLNNKKITNLNMSHATLISSSVWLLVFMILKLIIPLIISNLTAINPEIPEPSLFICSWCNMSFV